MPLIIRRANLTRAILIIHSDRWVCFVCVCWHCCVVFVANISAASNDFRMIMINTRKVHGTCVFGWTEGTRHHRIAGRSLERKCCRIDDDFRWSARVDVDVNNRRKNSRNRTLNNIKIHNKQIVKYELEILLRWFILTTNTNTQQARNVGKYKLFYITDDDTLKKIIWNKNNILP